MISRRTLLKSSFFTLISIKGIFAARTDSLNEDERKIVDALIPLKQYKPMLFGVLDYEIFDGAGAYQLVFIYINWDVYARDGIPGNVFVTLDNSYKNINWAKINKSLGYECKSIS